MAWRPGSGWLRWPAGPAGARRRSPAGRRWPAARAGGYAAWSSLHSPDGPDDPGRGVSGDGQPVEPDDAQERGLVGVGGGDHERVSSLDRGRAGHSGRGQVVPGCGLRGAGVDLDTLPSDGGTGQVHTQQHARDVAAQAARVGGEQVLAGPAIRGQGVQVDTGAAKSAARDYLAAAGVSGSATIQGGDTLVVTTTDTYQTTFLGIIGLNRLTVTGHASARIVRAVGGVER